MKVVIMRGISGSGKSTWVKENYPDAIICSADYHFYKYDRKQKREIYDFDPTKLGEAHKECMLSFVHNIAKNKEMFKDDTVVVVDNTNINFHEVTPYLRVAQAYDWEIEIVRVECDWGVAWERNKHGVPLKTIKRMYNNFKPLPKFFGEEIVVKNI